MGWMGGCGIPVDFPQQITTRGSSSRLFWPTSRLGTFWPSPHLCLSPVARHACTQATLYNTIQYRGAAKSSGSSSGRLGGGGGIQVVRAETWTAATMTIHKVHQTHQTNENPPRLLWPLIAVCPFAPCHFRRSASVCGIEKHHKTPATASYFDGDPRSRTNSFLGSSSRPFAKKSFLAALANGHYQGVAKQTTYFVSTGHDRQLAFSKQRHFASRCHENLHMAILQSTGT